MNPILFALTLLPFTTFAQCDTIIGEVNQLSDYPSSYNYLNMMGYCYEIETAQSITADFTFTAVNHTALFSLAYSAIGCTAVNITGSSLIDPVSCDTIQSGFVFNSMTIGADYIWRVSLVSSGVFCQGISTVCPYFIAFNFLPVKMNAFAGVSRIEGIKLKWSTLSETNSKEFIIQRADESLSFVEVGRVNSSGNSNSLRSYQFIDRSALIGANYYRLIEVDFNGDRVVYDPIFVNHSVPVVVGLFNLVGQFVDAGYDGLKIIVYENGEVDRVF